MKKGKKRKSATKLVESIFTEEAILNMRKSIAHAESFDMDKPDRTFSKYMRFFAALTCLSLTALEECSPKQKARILARAERAYSRFGVTVWNIESPVKKCLTKSHAECRGFYDNPFMHDTVKCECRCHSKEDS